MTFSMRSARSKNQIRKSLNEMELAPRGGFEPPTFRLTAVNLISSQVAGAELNRGKSASSDQIGLIRYRVNQIFLLISFFTRFL